MSNGNEDYPVKPLSDYDVEQLAWRLRLSTGTANELAPDLVRILEILAAQPGPLEGLKLDVRPDEEMRLDEALAFVDERVLQVRETVFEGAKIGKPRDRMTIAHEIGHFALGHGGAPKHRVALGNKTLAYIPHHKSAEHQARVFGATFLMLRAHVRGCKTPAELASKLKVSTQAAQIRFDQVNVKDAPKNTPPDIQDGIEQLKRKTSSSLASRSAHRSMLSVEQQAKIAGELGQVAKDLDPAEYRCVDNRWIIRWSRFRRHTSGGWWLDAVGNIVVWDDDNSK